MMKNADLLVTYAEVTKLVEKNGPRINELKKVSDSAGIFWLIAVWLTTGVALLASVFLYHYDLRTFLFAYPLLIFIIAGRQGAFLQLIHEASHKLITRDKKLNDNLGEWLCAAPIGLSMAEYRKDHGRHHNHTNTARDCENDLLKYQETDISKWPLRYLFIKDIFGISAIERVIYILKKKNSPSNEKYKNLRIVVLQVFLIVAAFQLDFLLYILLWIVPLFTANMVLMRVRGVAEHGLPKQISVVPVDGREGAMLTRTLNSPSAQTSWIGKMVERILIGSLSINFHLEHHVVPNVPHYNLKKLYDILNIPKNIEGIENYKNGYFSSLFFKSR